ncbi:MAG: AAA family ATPase [Planctomycetota bacterium]|nr:AAA family ATPase [Planctomycetota bacterium]
MKLESFRVTNYRCVQDSGWIDMDDITVLVGKNESGKTSLLKALHKFKPFKPEPYLMDREWPRGRRTDRSENAVAVAVRFTLEEAERQRLSEIGSGADKATGVEITKTYRGDFVCRFLPEDLSAEHDKGEFKWLLSQEVVVPVGVSEKLRSAVASVLGMGKESVEANGVATFNQKVAEFSQAIDQGVDAENKADQEAAQAVKSVLTELGKKATLPGPKTQADALATQWIPTFIYMDEHRPFSGIAFLDQIKQRKDKNGITDQDKTILMILGMAGIDFEKEVGRANAQDKEQRMLDMNDASLTLTNLIADHWSQRRYEVRFEADGNHLIAFVKDQVQTALVPLDERSKGFQWFFSFDMTFLCETKGTFKGAVVLLDEPGLHLHAAAQRDLLKRMKEYAKGNQLIYSTHMPFMIDMERLDNIRVCTESKEAGTKVTADFYAADQDARFPLQAALGLSMSQSLFVGQYNLVVEGITDFWMLSSMASILREGNEPSLDERIVITPSGGATKAAYVATMLQGQQLNVVVLLDSDPEGKNVADGLIKNWIMKDRHVMLLGDVIARKEETTLEDLFPLEFYLGYVNTTYKTELGTSGLSPSEVNAGHHPQVVRQIDATMRARGLPVNSKGIAFNKGRVAKRMMEDFARKTTKNLPGAAVEVFRNLFLAINKAMPGLAPVGESVAESKPKT